MHKYILEPYKSPSTRHRCPACNKSHIFALYIDLETNEPIHDKVGRCNREVECGYHYPPKRYFADNGISIDNTPYVPPVPKPEQVISYIDPEIFKKSLAAYGSNNFVKFLHTLFDQKIVEDLISKYFIGTSSHWPGATVFWQVDHIGKIRTGKIMLYNHLTGKRVKEPYNHLTWSHKVLNIQDFNHKLCLFGAHLLEKQPTKPIAIVESEKTAIICSVYLPQFLWLAVGGLSQLTLERCSILRGRSVVLYPDLNAFDKWQAKGKELGFATSSILEKKATQEERDLGLDIADFLIKSKINNIDINIASVSDSIHKVIQLPTFKADSVIEAINDGSSISIIKPEVLELHKQYSNAESSGKLSDHPDRELIGQLWQDVLTNYHTPAVTGTLSKLHQIALFYF